MNETESRDLAGKMKQNKIYEYISSKYGKEKLDVDHADFDIDIYMMYIYRSIEKEMIDYQDAHKKSYDKMIGNLDLLTTYTNGKTSYGLYIPLNFWFNKNMGSAFPLIASQYSDLAMKLKLRKQILKYILLTNYYPVFHF